MKPPQLRRPDEGEEYGLLISVGYYLLLLLFVGVVFGWLYRLIP